MVSPEGFAPICVSLVVAGLVTTIAGTPWGAPVWGLTAYLCFVFYEPRVQIPALPLGVLSPVTGRVCATDQTRDPWRGCEVMRIRIRIRPPGVTSVRSPVEGKVADYWTEADPFGATADIPAHPSRSPSCYAVLVRTDEGDEVTSVLSSRRPISRFRLRIAPGERVGHGQPQGFGYFASYVDVLMPLGTLAVVREGEPAVAGSTVLASLVHD